MNQFKLKCTLEGHQKDVRDVVCTKSSIISGSRDGTIRRWISNPEWRSDKVEQRIIFSSPSDSFVNSVAFLDDFPGNLLAGGGKDCSIYIVSQDHDVVGLDLDDYLKYQLVGHEGNVCSLDHKGGYLISSSWDATSIVWDLNTMSPKFHLTGHLSSVWDAKIVDPERNIFLTCSADRTIRKWCNDKVIWDIPGHNDVIRKLLLLPDGKRFASCSNDGLIKIWDLESGKELQILKGHESFVYDLDVLPNGDILSSGEDRRVHIWRDGSLLQAITLPCISVWCVSSLLNGDFVAGGSDSILRIFTRDPSGYAPNDELIAFQESVQNSAIAEQSIGEINKTDLPGYEALQTSGKNEGQTIMVKNSLGMIEAHQWSGGEWVKIGDVLGSARGNDEKKEFDGSLWDYVFDVDIEDGAPPLKLPYNANENPYTAAERFLSKNELPNTYTQEVVDFITKNTGGVTLDQPASTQIDNPYADSNHRFENMRQKSQFKVLPVKEYVHFATFKLDQLQKGLQKFNSEQDEVDKFSDQEVEKILALLSNLGAREAVELIDNYLPKILHNWKQESKLIGYDILRVSIAKITTAEALSHPQIAEKVDQFIFEGFNSINSSDITLIMMLFKVISNLVGNTIFIQGYLTTNDQNMVVFAENFKRLGNIIIQKTLRMSSTSVATSSKHYGSSMTSLATFIYNLTAEYIKNTSLNLCPKNSELIYQFITELGGHICKSGIEPSYRILFAYGQLKYGVPSLPAPSFYTEVVSKYRSNDPTDRFFNIISDIEIL